MTTYYIAALALLCALPLASMASAAIPRPEHPRPDFQRDNWLNLNGEWQFEIDDQGDGLNRGLISGKELSQRITVPYCPESKLSGIGHRDFMKNVWYRRTFEAPAAMRGKRVFLHFGAVDWLATVWVNGKQVGAHRGGYVPFSFEITDCLTNGANEIVLHAFDDTRSGAQATGKQAHSQESEGCVYTRTTGIWQTVWLEATGAAYLREFVVTPDVDAGRITLQGWVDGASKGAKVRVRAYAGKTLVGEETVNANWRATQAVLPLKTIRKWQPGKPFLYELLIEVEQGGKVVDTVHSYFGMRKLTISGNRFLINDKPVFQRLVLDQGFYPDGIYTAATDAALKQDVELSMAAGFNGARLHEKVFDPRLLYWADKLGYLVWGEYPNWGLNTSNPEAAADAVAEWRTALKRDRNHPCIIGWCPLNETDSAPSVPWLQAMMSATREIDPTRPYLDTSGYVHFDIDTDVYDCHDYDQNPETFRARFAVFAETGEQAWNNIPNDPRSAYRGQPYFVSEYGGIKLSTGEHVGQKGWGYGETDLKGYLERYKGLTDVLLDNPNMFAFCYTQLTDVEQEQNGIFYYDRRHKYDPALVAAINKRAAAYETQGPKLLHVDWQVAAPTAEREPVTWSFTTAAPEGEWFATTFDDHAWSSGPGGFGTEGTPGAIVRTVWNTPDIWLRRWFDLADAVIDLAGLRIHHDEDADVYVNGVLVKTLKGYGSGYTDVDMTAKLKPVLKSGRNLVAIHCHQTDGGQYIDAGIVLGKARGK